MQTKICKTCGETKPVGQFGVHPTGKYGVKAHCKSCYNSKFPQSIEYRWMHRYGLTPEAYQEGQVKDDPRILLAMIDYLAGVGE